jgi:undecaprenyl-diphosphatase
MPPSSAGSDDSGAISHDVDPDLLLERALAAGILVAGGLLVGLAAKRRFGAVVFVLVAVGGAAVLETLSKHAFKRPPLDPSDHGYSFPSGTAAVSAAAVTALSLAARDRRVRSVVAAAGLAVASAYGALAVDAGWHYPSDVVAGWALAVAWVSAISVVASGTRVAVLSRRGWDRTGDRPRVKRTPPSPLVAADREPP